MSRILILVLFSLAAPLLMAQGSNTITMPMGVKSNSSYSYDVYPFPSGIMVYTLDKERLELKPEGLSLVTVFGLCCGVEPEVWNRVIGMEQQYKDLGMNTYMINFENGGELAMQLRDVKKFVQTNTRPENLLIDSMGYTIDFLTVPGFPTYFLVDKEGNVVFRTNGKDEEGMQILESEIQTRIEQ